MKSKHRTRITLPAAAYYQLAAGPFAALVVAGLSVSANAAAITWNSGGSANWSATSNWVGGIVPVAADSLVFGATTGVTTLNNDLTAGFSFAALTFNLGASAYTLNGNSITLTGNVTNNSTSLQTIGFNIATTAVRTFTTTTGGGDLAVTGAISGTGGGITKAGSGTLTLAGNNTYTGGTTVSAGTLTLNKATGSLASTSALTFNSQGGTFAMDNTGAVGALSQSLGALTFSAGEGTVKLTRTASQDQALTFASYARTAGATANFVNTGGTNSATNGFNFASRAAGFFGQAVFFNGDNYAWLNGNNTFVRALAYGTDSGAVTSANTTSLANATHQQITGAVTAQTSATFTTLKLAGTSDLTLVSGATLTTNGLLKTGGNSATLSGGTGLQAANNVELVIRTDVASDSLTLSTPVLANGSNALTKSGEGTLNLSGTGNTYTGATRVNAGTLNLTGSLTGGTAISTSGTGVFTQSSAGVISGGSALTQASSGTSVLAGNNTYTGTTTVSTGILNIQHANALGTTAGSTSVATGAQLQLQGNITVAEALSLTGTGISSTGALRSLSGANTLTGAITGAYSLFVDTGSSLSITGSLAVPTLLGGGDFNISGNITGTRLTLSSTGAVTLSGTNTLTQQILLSSGTLNVNSAGALGGNLADFNFNASAAIDNTSGSALTVNSNSKINFQSVATPFTAFSTAAGTTANSLTFAAATNGLALGTRTFTLNGAGSLSFEGTATNGAGNTVLTVNNGASNSGIFGAFNFGGLALSNTTDNTARTVTINGTGTMNITGAVTNGNAAGGQLIKDGSGTLTLSGNNTYTGNTTLTGGTLSVGATSNLGNASSNLVFNGGTLQITGTTLNNFSGIGRTVSFTAAKAVGLDIANAANTFTVDQALNQTTGGFNKLGAGTAILNQTNTYTGATTLTAGTLSVGVTSNLGAASSNLVFNGGTLQITGTTLNNFSGIGHTVSFTAAQAVGLDMANAANTFTVDQVLNQTTGGFNKLGAGTAILNKTNTYTGLTTVSGGALNISSAGSLNSGNALTVGASGTANFANAGQTLGAVSNSNSAANALNFSASSGTVTLASLTGTGNTRFGSIGSVTGGISGGTVTSVGALNANISGGTITAGGLLTGTISSGTVGAASLSSTSVTGGTNTITGAAGITTLNGGTTTVGGVATIGTMTSGTANFNGATSAITTLNGGTLNLGGSTVLTVSDGNSSGAITGSGGALTKTSAGTLTLTGANTYTGATLITAGTLALGASGTIDNTSEVSLGTVGTFDVSAKSGYAVGTLKGSGNVTGALTVSTTLAIGNSPGTINFSSNLTLDALSTYKYELIGGVSPGFGSADLADVAGNLTISAGSILDLVQLGTYTANNKFTLFAYDGALNGTFMDMSSNVLADGATFTGAGGTWMIDYNDAIAGANGGVSASNTYVTITAIPEPNAAALIGGLGVLVLLRRRR